MNKYLIIGIAALVLIALGGFLIWQFGEAKEDVGKKTEQAIVNKENVKKVKRYEKRKQENRTIADDELVKRYCRWVYGTTYDECVSSYKFVD